MLSTAQHRAIAAVLAVAAAALCFSLWLDRRLPLFRHPDEAIVANLSLRATQTHRPSVNWDGFPGTFWSRPSYQFSPHTLLQISVDSATRATTLEERIRSARRFSSVLAAIVLLVTALAALELTASGFAAVLAELILATSIIHVQNAIYARCEALLSLAVALTLLFSLRGRRPGSTRQPLLLAAAFAGLAVATKYNAAPVVLLAAYPLLGSKSWREATASAVLMTAVFAVTFLVATPEILLDAGPFIAGLRYELTHYASAGQPLHQTFDGTNGNLRYWVTYLGRLGYGWIPLVATVAFVLFAMVRKPEWRMVAAFLLVGGAVVFGVKVRFERNVEILLPAAAVAAGAFLEALVAAARGMKVAAAFVLMGALALQPAQVLRDFVLQATAPLPGLPTGHDWTFHMALEPPKEEDRGRRDFVLFDFREPFSRAGAERWRAFLGPHDEQVISSLWADKGYPFSTIDVYHGPTRLLLMTRR